MIATPKIETKPTAAETLRYNQLRVCVNDERLARKQAQQPFCLSLSKILSVEITIPVKALSLGGHTPASRKSGSS